MVHPNRPCAHHPLVSRLRWPLAARDLQLNQRDQQSLHSILLAACELDARKLLQVHRLHAAYPLAKASCVHMLSECRTVP